MNRTPGKADRSFGERRRGEAGRWLGSNRYRTSNPARAPPPDRSANGREVQFLWEAISEPANPVQETRTSQREVKDEHERGKHQAEDRQDQAGEGDAMASLALRVIFDLDQRDG